jgi:putative membrane protein
MKEKTYNIPIAVVSIAVPLVVIFMFYLKPPQLNLGIDLRLLPAFHASLNFTTAILLCVGYYCIRTGRRTIHKYCMITAFVLSCIFLISYVVYHMFTPPTHYGGEGAIKYIYFFILITHISLSAIIIPLVLFTMTRALQERFDKHKRIARRTLPIWLYVAVTGVIVYLMISPYYTV